jgi:predicted heme/steroid binding protein/uncharacterized membrane protein
MFNNAGSLNPTGARVKSISREDLAENNGQDGKRAFVAVDGKVYDVTKSKRWPGGAHMKRHQAGADLSNDIRSAPHDLDVLERFETIGVLAPEEKPPVAGVRARVETFLDAYPWFRRHPHPSVVHFPVGFLMGAPLFETLGLVSNSAKTEWAAYCCLLIAAMSIPAAIVTGYFTWWVNYELHDSPIIARKRQLAWVALAIAGLAVVVRSFLLANPLDVRAGSVLIYAVVLWGLAAVVGYIGFLGGKLVFPYDSH